MKLLLILNLSFAALYNVFSGQKRVAKGAQDAAKNALEHREEIAPPNAVQNETKYSKLSDEEKEKVKKIVYILDRFGVSNEAYHEFTQLEDNDSMTRSYLVEECQAEMNKHIRAKISRTPGPHQGAEMSFPELLKKELSKNVSKSFNLLNNYNQKYSVS